jgi:beta-galactosidase/beta-glucuronidase
MAEIKDLQKVIEGMDKVKSPSPVSLFPELDTTARKTREYFDQRRIFDEELKTDSSLLQRLSHS